MIENEKNIQNIRFQSGAYYIVSPYGGELIIEIDSKKLMGRYNYKSRFYKISVKWKINKEIFLKFIEEIIKIDIFSWNKNYNASDVLDGGYWSLIIEYNKNETFEVIGDNAYPDNFDEFYKILKKYFSIIRKDYEYRKEMETNYIKQMQFSHNEAVEKAVLRKKRC